MSLQDIVNVSIDATTRTPTRAGFGTPLLVTYHANFPELVRTYSEPADLLVDGFLVTDPTYLMAVALKAQDPSVNQFKVGRRATAFSQAFRLTPVNTAEGYVYNFTIVSPDGTVTAITYTNGAAETVASIVTALTALITAITDLTAADNVTHISVTADNSGELFDVLDSVSASDPVFNAANMAFIDETVDPGIVADMTAIRSFDDDWYGFTLDCGGKATWTALAVWVEAETILALADSMDTEILLDTAGNLFEVLETAAYARTVGCFNRNRLLSWFGTRWMGAQLPRDPGTSTWAFKELAGLVPDKLTTTEKNAIRNLDTGVGAGNYYIRLARFNVTLEGTSGSGEYIDITRGIDLITARMQEGVFGLLASQPKIPYEDSGVDQIRSEMLGVLGRVTSTPAAPNILAADPAPTVTAPLVSTIDTADKALRRLPDMNFQGTLSGAIHKVVITGTLTV